MSVNFKMMQPPYNLFIATAGHFIPEKLKYWHIFKYYKAKKQPRNNQTSKSNFLGEGKN